MTNRNPHDLNQIRPSAELYHPAGQTAPTARTRPATGRRRRQRRPRPPRQGWSMLAKIATGLGVFMALIVAGIASFLVVVSPAELVRNELIRQVKSNTGRDLRINGGAHFVFYPNIGVSLGNVELSGPPGMKAAPTLTAETIDVSVALMPLLNRQVHVDHIGLVRPVIYLHVDSKGRQSWEFADRSGNKMQAPRVRVASISSGLGTISDAVDATTTVIIPAVLPGVAGAGLLDKLELRSIRLTKAVIRYRDERSGTSQQIEELDLQLNGRRISDPLEAKGRLVWQNEPLDFTARLDTLSQLLANRAAKARVTVAGRPVSAGFDGTLKLGGALEVAGQTRLSGDSLASTSRWLGMVFPNAAPLGGFQVSGRLVGSPKSIALNSAAMSLGQTKATGVVLVEIRPKRPYISTDLKVSELDIDRLSAGFSGARPVARSAATRSSRGATTPAHTAPEDKSSPQSIEDLLRRSQMPGQDGGDGAGRFAPQVRGYTNRNEWSSERIDVSALGLVDAKARLRIAGLKVGGLSIGTTAVRLALTDSSARIDIDDIQLYQGGGRGVITARPVRGGVGIGANLRIDKISARPMLKDAADFDRLDGRGNLVVVVSSSGDSQKALASRLGGTASFAFQDGAIVGWNLAKIIRGLQNLQFSNFDAVSSEQTDFSELSGSFKIASGVATTNDLRMSSPLLRLNGDGQVGVGARDLNLGLRPKLVSSLRGQGVRGEGGDGLEIPVKLKGPWHDPRIVPDSASIAKDPAKILDQVQKLGEQFKGKKNVGDLVRGVLGQGGDGQNNDRGENGAEPQGGIKPKELLKQLFR